jgi:hypothetical protein
VEDFWLCGGHGAIFLVQGSWLCGRYCPRCLGSVVGLVEDSWLCGGYGPKLLVRLWGKPSNILGARFLALW